ncbi:MAG: hypothetical protein ACYCVD_06705 [Desulfitobacteriaceae bacterium]
MPGSLDEDNQTLFRLEWAEFRKQVTVLAELAGHRRNDCRTRQGG